MSIHESREFEVREVFPYPDPTVGKGRKFMIFEYKVVKTEINRYEITVKEAEF